jgi:hypothetical protein
MAIVNRFTVKEDIQLFEREFLQHTGWFGSQASIDFMATCQVIKRPKVYWHFGFWQTLAAFVEAVHDETYLRRAERLGRMVDTRADQTVSVRRVAGEGGCDITPSTAVAITHFRVAGNFRSFERNLWERCDVFVRHAGPSTAQVLRSIISPRGYIGIEWAADRRLFEGARNEDLYRQPSSRLAEMADVESDEVRIVSSQAGGRTLVAPVNTSPETDSPAGP